MNGPGDDGGRPVLTPAAVARLAGRLASVGLNRCQAAPVADLPPSVWLGGAGPEQLGGLSGESTGATLLLVGHGGRALWRHLHGPSGFDFDRTADPIDTFSVSETESVLISELPGVEYRLLYPTPDCPVDLVALGVHLGWQAPSPLGLGIDPVYGLWSAYRALWVLDTAAAAAAVSPVPAPDVCGTCIPQSCVDACPANAVGVGRAFSLTKCHDHRSRRDSSCSQTCLSRWACPVGRDHRYEPDQMSYHYRRSRPPTSEASS